jgi:hypothetical protein
MPTIHARSRRPLAAVAGVSLALTLLVGACGGSDDDEATDRADTESAAVDDEGTTTTAASGEATPSVPQDSDVNAEVRHPHGTTLTVDHIAFDDENILLDVSVVNGSPSQIIIHSVASPRGGRNQLRLVDDAGNSYNFVLPEDEADAPYIAVEQGETLSGTLAFVGPLGGHPEQLRLVTNVDPEDVDAWSIEDEAANSTNAPGLVVPIDLMWE